MEVSETRQRVMNENGGEGPRERLIRSPNGPIGLGDDELLAILLGTGQKGEGVMAFARRILQEFNNDLFELRQTNLAALKDITGLGGGQAKACVLLAALELGYRSAFQRKTLAKMETAADIYNAVRPSIELLESEEFWLGIVDNQNKLRYLRCAFKGGVAGTSVDPSKLFTIVLRSGYTGFFVAHNHPGGSTKPSQPDREVTQKLQEGAEILNLRFLDHVIVAKDGTPNVMKYYSFRDHNDMIPF